MRKYSVIYVTALLFLAIGIFLNAERIINNDVVIQINKDKSITVNEKIEYEFDSLEKRGIFREIPLRSRENGGEIGRSIIKMNKITKNGIPEKYTAEEFKDGIRYKIGKEKVFVDRLANVYEINYTMPNEIPEKDGVYQIYFNAIGQFWPVAIENAEITIKFPDGQPIEKNEILKFEVYTGAHGEKSDNYEIVQSEGEIKIKTKAPLPKKNGLTFLMHTDTKKISPSGWDKIKLDYYLEPMKFIAPGIIILIILYCLGTWIKYGKDLKKRIAVPNFSLPKDMSAMFTYFFERKRAGMGIDNNKMLSIGVLSLISKGYIDMENDKADEKKVKYRLNESKVNDLRNGRSNDLFHSEIEIARTLNPGERIFFNNGKIYMKMRAISNSYGKEYRTKMYDNNTLLKVSVMFILVFFTIMTLIAAESKTIMPLTLIPSMYITVTSAMALSLFSNKSFKKHILSGKKAFSIKMKIAACLLCVIFLLASLILPGMRAMMTGILVFSLALGIVIAAYNELRGEEKKSAAKTVLIIIGVLFYLLMMLFIKNGIYSIVIFAIYMVYSRLIGRFTEEGMRAKEIIDGMKMYIKTAGENQIRQFDDMEGLISSFRTILPFAMAVGAENEAMKLMQKTIAKNNLSLSSIRIVTAEELIEMMMAVFLLSEAKHAYTSSEKIYSARHSSSSSSSGGSFSSGGGGSSGGGFGGGGGGSW